MLSHFPLCDINCNVYFKGFKLEMSCACYSSGTPAILTLPVPLLIYNLVLQSLHFFGFFPLPAFIWKWDINSSDPVIYSLNPSSRIWKGEIWAYKHGFYAFKQCFINSQSSHSLPEFVELKDKEVLVLKQRVFLRVPSSLPMSVSAPFLWKEDHKRWLFSCGCRPEGYMACGPGSFCI